MKVLLVGVDHRIQWVPQPVSPEWQRDLREFAHYLEDQARCAGADVIAEELSEESLARSQARASVAREVASLLEVRHLFCDPDSAQRQQLSIEADVQREQYWLQEIEQARGTVTLFICGDNHVDSFEQRCKSTGLETKVLSRNWGKGWQLKD